MIRLFTLNHIRLADAEEMELWELAAACGTYLGPTAEERKIEEMYEQEAELKAAMLERARRRQGDDYDSQDMPADVRVH